MKNTNSKKIALVTGASSGIGQATVLKLLQDGFIVYGVARRVERMKEIEAAGAETLYMDLTEESSIEQVVSDIIEKHKRIDILINNAGYGSFGAVEDVDIQEAKRQFEVNVFGLARLTQLVLPHMRKHNYGKIVNVSSMGGKLHTHLGAWYHATKFALEGLSDCLRLEIKQFGIDVIIIEPGSIDSEWTGLAVDSMLQTSGNTAYGDYTDKVAKMIDTAVKAASPPQIIANVISKAVRAKHPKTRYVAGKYAKKFLFFRKILPDRMYDKLLHSCLNNYFFI